MPTSTKKITTVLEHITGLTAQTDFELLTFSLLKSLTELLPTANLQTLSIDSNNIPMRQYRFNAGKLQMNHDDQLGEDVLQVIINTHIARKSSQLQTLNNHTVGVYQLGDWRNYESYLVVIMPVSANAIDEALISGVLGVYRNFSALLHHSQTDELTGLANRKTFESTISRLYQFQNQPRWASELNQRLSDQEASCDHWICSIDIDHFKTVNDNFGHLFGDEVLLRIAQIMQREFRDNDRLFRFGGEEFIVLLSAPDRDAATAALERFKDTVANTHFAGIDTITVSIGVVKIDPATFHMTLMSYADQALYHSKHEGRNRITFFDDMVEQGIAQLETFSEGSVDLF